MAGVGLAGVDLDAFLEVWMKLVSADVAEMAQSGIAGTIPGSRAAELLMESRLGRAVVAIAGECATCQAALDCLLGRMRAACYVMLLFAVPHTPNCCCAQHVQTGTFHEAESCYPRLETYYSNDHWLQLL